MMSQPREKSLYDDIAQLNDFGIKTQKTQYGRTVHYKVIGRAFELAELKLLVDSVAAAKFITEEKSNELIKKLESLTSRQEAATLQRQVYVAGRVKTMNSDIMKMSMPYTMQLQIIQAFLFNIAGGIRKKSLR